MGLETFCVEHVPLHHDTKLNHDCSRCSQIFNWYPVRMHQGESSQSFAASGNLHTAPLEGKLLSLIRMGSAHERENLIQKMFFKGLE